MDSSFSEGTTPTKLQPEPTVVQTDPSGTPNPFYCSSRVMLTCRPPSLHSALKEFLEPLGTNDPRTDFIAVYRRESEEFDRDYARKYDDNLNTSLIFVSPRVSVLPTDH